MEFNQIKQFSAQELINHLFFRWIIPKQIIKLSSSSFKVEWNSKIQSTIISQRFLINLRLLSMRLSNYLSFLNGEPFLRSYTLQSNLSFRHLVSPFISSPNVSINKESDQVSY